MILIIFAIIYIIVWSRYFKAKTYHKTTIIR